MDQSIMSFIFITQLSLHNSRWMVVDATLPLCLLILKIPLLGAATSPRPRVAESLDPRLKGANSHPRAAVNCPSANGRLWFDEAKKRHQQQQKQDPETTEPSPSAVSHER